MQFADQSMQTPVTVVGTNYHLEKVYALSEQALTIFTNDQIVDKAIDYVSALHDYRSNWPQMNRAEMSLSEEQIVILGQALHKDFHRLLQQCQSIVSALQVKRSSADAYSTSPITKLLQYIHMGRQYELWIRLSMRDQYSLDADDARLPGLIRTLKSIQAVLQLFADPV
jgi:esterase/lipase